MIARTRFAALSTLSRNVGVGGPSPQGSVGEGIRRSRAGISAYG
jgi:hypothetical protein